MRIYEELFIVKTDTGEEAIDQLTEQLKQVIMGAGGEVQKIDKWGIRRLAYRIHKQDEGFYVLMLFNSTPGAVLEIERRLRVSDSVLKFLTVRIDLKLKRVEKRKKQREKRAARKPSAPAAPAPQAPVSVEAAFEAGGDKE
jgi:small subunit ribosomal protein S6